MNNHRGERMKYKCIIFDCDGILVDSETISARIFLEMAAELNFHMDLSDAVDKFTGISMKDQILFLEDQLNQKVPDDFEKEFRQRTYDVFRNKLKPVEGIRELLEKITVFKGVASSGPCEKIRLNLSTTGLIHHFGKNIFSSYDIGSWKPHPEIYLYAARQMGFKPDECAVVEDSLAGVQSAVAGGFDVYALSSVQNSQTFAQMGARVFQEMKILASLLELS